MLTTLLLFMSLKLLLLYQVNVHQLIKSNEHILIPHSQCLAAAFVLGDVFSFLKLATPLLSVNAHSPGLPYPSNLPFMGYSPYTFSLSVGVPMSTILLILTTLKFFILIKHPIWYGSLHEIPLLVESALSGQICQVKRLLLFT